MPAYFISHLKNVDLDFEVHVENCAYIPLPEYRTLIGEFQTAEDAISTAKKQHKNVNACYSCLKGHYKEIISPKGNSRVENL